MSTIYLMPLGAVEPLVLSIVTSAVEQSFLKKVRLQPGVADIAFALDTVRNQYHVSHLLGDLIKKAPPDAEKIIGVAEIDLFLPIFTFVFGTAQLKGIGALVSTFRLRPEYYGLPPDPLRFAERVRKEAIHELGHTYGLIHCIDPVCVMRSSTYVEDVDFKAATFCMGCRTQLNARLAEEK